MKRVNIYISEQQYQQLKQLAEETGLKSSEHVRRAIDEYFAKRKREQNRSNA